MKIEETLEISIVWLVGYTGLQLKYGIFQHNTILKALTIKDLKSLSRRKRKKKTMSGKQLMQGNGCSFMDSKRM